MTQTIFNKINVADGDKLTDNSSQDWWIVSVSFQVMFCFGTVWLNLIVHSGVAVYNERREKNSLKVLVQHQKAIRHGD